MCDFVTVANAAAEVSFVLHLSFRMRGGSVRRNSSPVALTV